MAFVNLGLALYPVGSVYLSVSNISPAGILGGTWNQVSGANLFAANTTISAGSFGGNKKITSAQLPPHAHKVVVSTGGSADYNVGLEYANTDTARITSNDLAVAKDAAAQDFTPYSFGVNVWYRTA